MIITRNSEVFDPYLRLDIKLTYRINSLKASHEFGLDIVNITNRENVLKQTYISGGHPPVQDYFISKIIDIALFMP